MHNPQRIPLGEGAPLARCEWVVRPQFKHLSRAPNGSMRPAETNSMPLDISTDTFCDVIRAAIGDIGLDQFIAIAFKS